MKHRLALVSNSSSSSFTILKKELNSKQIYMIKNYLETGANLGMWIPKTATWVVEDMGSSLKLSTDMDGFDMLGLLEKIDFDIKKIIDYQHSNM